MSGGSVYKNHTFNKETAYTPNEDSTIHRTNLYSTIQVHKHKNTRSTWTLQNAAENTDENKMNIQLVKKSGPSSL
jgi:hypothetical protein